MQSFREAVFVDGTPRHFPFKIYLYHIYLGSWCMKVRRQLWESAFFSCYLVCPRDGTQVIKLSNKGLHLLSHLAFPPSFFLCLPSYSLQPFSFLSFRPFPQQSLAPFTMESSPSPGSSLSACRSLLGSYGIRHKGFSHSP